MFLAVMGVGEVVKSDSHGGFDSTERLDSATRFLFSVGFCRLTAAIGFDDDIENPSAGYRLRRGLVRYLSH